MAASERKPPALTAPDRPAARTLRFDTSAPRVRRPLFLPPRDGESRR